jgi:probable HAF family extracellular repeat protein
MLYPEIRIFCRRHNSGKLSLVLIVLAVLSLGTSRLAAVQNPVYTITDLGTLGGTTTVANKINNCGEVVGTARLASGQQHAYLYRNGVMQDLGTLGGNLTEPAGINIRGQVVGRARNAPSGTATRAFLWENGVMKDLNELIPAGSGWVLLQATAINAAGQIVGNGTLNGQDRAFLLTPRR